MKKVIRTPDFPIVKTKQGKLHGYQEDQVFHFYGIRYGRAGQISVTGTGTKLERGSGCKLYGYIVH